jgi:hypothetical protein
MARDTSAEAVAGCLLRIISKEEMMRLSESLARPANASADDIGASLAALPRYEIARITLKLANSTIRLLQDVFECLGSLGVSARTTGCVFVLADPLQPGRKSELEFSPQAVGSICQWPTDWDWAQLADTLSSLKSKWGEFHPVLRRMLAAARPERRRGGIDVVPSAIEGREVRKPDRLVRDEAAERVLHLVTTRVTDLVNRFGQFKEPLPPEVTWILRDADEFLCDAKKVLPERKSRWERVEPNKYELRQHERFLRDFDRAREDLLLVADLTEGDRLFDMLRLDVWSSRPQLYEVWVLLTILRWLAGRGYGVRLLKLRQSTAVTKWELAYSKDDEPCATVQGEPGTPQAFLFYQLYRPSGDMPDLSLLNGSAPDSPRIWSVDPKHSEKSGYSLKDYRLTAERYRDSFGAPVSVVAEYFERSDCESNPVNFGSGACLVHNCHPGEPGRDLLLLQLAPCHPVITTTLVCIDVSQSFRDRLPSVLPHIREIVDSTEERCLDEFICFAGSALKTRRLRSRLESISSQGASSLGMQDGTLAGPLLDAVAEVAQSARISRLLLVTDGGFDEPLETVLQHIRSELNLDVTVVP